MRGSTEEYNCSYQSKKCEGHQTESVENYGSVFPVIDDNRCFLICPDCFCDHPEQNKYFSTHVSQIILLLDFLENK